MRYKLFFKTPTHSNFFNGYYDKTPVSNCGNLLLAIKVKFIDRLPNKSDKAEIGFFNLTTRKYSKLTYTNIFNWQQGSMLSWVGSNNKHIIFNRMIKNKFRSIVLDIKTRKERILSKAIYTINKEGNLALCIDFERHFWIRRAYSYDGIYNVTKNCKVYRNDEITLLNLSNNKFEKVVSILDLLKIKKIFSMVDATHYMEHLMFSPNANKFAFLHRWKDSNSQIYTRLYTYSFKEKKLELILDTGRLTHYCWIDDDRLLAFGSSNISIASIVRRYKLTNFILRFILPIYRKFIKPTNKLKESTIKSIVTGDSYFSVNIKNGTKKKLLNQILSKDGHPTLFKNTNFFLTDTYPNEKSIANLLIADLENKKLEKVDSLNSIKKFDNSPLRCDLHPKLSNCENFIAVDTMHEGVRSIFLYKKC
jgi:hypothetical protein